VDEKALLAPRVAAALATRRATALAALPVSPPAAQHFEPRQS